MTHIRREFPESVKRAALERAQHRCQDPLCGVSEEWLSLQQLGRNLNIWITGMGGATMAHLIALRDAMMAARFKHPRALNPIIKRFKLDGGALLEVDHERECADGGAAVLDNAVVRCVFCHAFKTQDRAQARRRAPKIVKGTHRVVPEQTNLITRATVLGLQGRIDKELTRGCTPAVGRMNAQLGEVPVGRADGISGKGTQLPGRAPTSSREPQPRRQGLTDAQFQDVLRAKQEAADNYPWGA